MSLINTPLKIRDLTLNSRLVMPPMATSKADGGKVSDDLLEYYRQRAEGGYIGLIITEHCYIAENGKASENQVSVAKDEDIPGLSRLAQTIRKDGSKAFLQINHAGLNGIGDTVYGPSAITLPNGKNKDKKVLAFTKDELAGLIRLYADAALRVKKAGFDGVEIHAAHGYLLNQFYTPLLNKREDEYGGSLDNRIRIILEVIKAVRETVGPDFTVALRLGACDYGMPGTTIEDSVYAAGEFAEAGIDIIDITGGCNGFVRKDVTYPGYFKDASAPIKKAVDIPVILTGGIRDINDAEKLLEEGAADLIGVGRALFQDADWAFKAMAE
ncbi:MAG: NADH:flavin oxidoreductase [Erysipelotrichaceae bacterium]|nr:NADH:flavin oxidoreductase [Erysipelotrichaceae bacterium]